MLDKVSQDVGTLVLSEESWDDCSSMPLYDSDIVFQSEKGYRLIAKCQLGEGRLVDVKITYQLFSGTTLLFST